KGFAVAIVGGLGNIRGVVVAALVLATAETLGGAYVSLEWSYAILLVVMVAIILWRPYGLFRSAEAAGGDPLQADHLLGGAGAGLSRAALATRAGSLLRVLPRVAFAALVLAMATFPLWVDTYHDLSLMTF